MKIFLSVLTLFLCVNTSRAHHGSGGGYSFSANGSQNTFCLPKNQWLLINQNGYQLFDHGGMTDGFQMLNAFQSELTIGYGISNKVNLFVLSGASVLNSENDQFLSMKTVGGRVLYNAISKKNLKGNFSFQVDGPTSYFNQESPFWALRFQLSAQTFLMHKNWTLSANYNFPIAEDQSYDLGKQLESKITYQYNLTRSDSADAKWSIEPGVRVLSIGKTYNDNKVVFNTGSDQLLLSASVNLFHQKRWGFSWIIEKPVWQYVVGNQSTTNLNTYCTIYLRL